MAISFLKVLEDGNRRGEGALEKNSSIVGVGGPGKEGYIVGGGGPGEEGYIVGS